MATLAPPSRLKTPVVWRPLAADDLAYVAALEAQIHAVPWTLGNFRDALAAGYCALAGERDGRIVAFGVLMLAPGEAQVLNVSVVPDSRRAGLGRTLVRKLLDVAAAARAEQCFLEVRVSNLAAIALYQSEGFEAVARREGYYPATSRSPREDALVLRRALGVPTGSG